MSGLQGFRPVRDITDFAEVLKPEEAEPPILSPAIRLAVRQWLVELAAEEELASYGLKPRRTAMLSGPPGCGKTTLAHHFSARLGLPLILVNMASLITSFLGGTGQNVNKLFDAVRAQSQECILFLDEFDSVASKRVSGARNADNERNSIVISLLQKIDTFPGIMIAATNRSDDIDPAIWRRFGMQLEILEPDADARFAILTRYLAPMTLPEESMELLTEVTAGASPAVLRQLMEGLKRDVILAPRYGQPVEAKAVLSRLVASVRPHAEAVMPPLWTETWAMESIAKMPWPPVDGREDSPEAS
ncbi:AAA family ATPase [Tautonia plasticadhaerens]|uniref:ATP-dependent zinc metalloprotease FtsH 4 n=1 Tax=Tautonia plasticadhaerens TaxID=2527974 RepID=A0A518H265_9BACT|nr:ATP-binding protein [Tautonia plasticadhaerens]QDV34938.1 ATP-dependent zinc metalloprotease FtsH 4 [Tautonia plasticadhaerens]